MDILAENDKADKDHDKLDTNFDNGIKSFKSLEKQMADTQIKMLDCKRNSEIKQHVLDKHQKLFQAKYTKCDKSFLKNTLWINVITTLLNAKSVTKVLF